ncbi:MAG: DUF3526 domain-containing protein [Dinghuibacter sp.]|nr:DUF3526 domain-containing protein [Dinghuibacter sp.]
MYRLMFVQFLRNRTAIALLVLLTLTGTISLIMGKKFLAEQQKAVAETTQYQKAHRDRLLRFENKEMGLLLYYLKFVYVNPASPLSGLSIGQKDVNTSVQAPTIRGLEAQKYDTDIRNPYGLMAGNFDLGFVLLFLFPLVIIALCYNLYSEEKEKGTWPLLRVQYAGTTKYLLLKLSIPFLLVTGVQLVLYLLACGLLPLRADRYFAGFMLGNYLYTCSWFALCLLAVSFRKSSSFTAIVLVSAWLLLNIVVPAAVNDYVTRKYPVPESLSVMLKQRDGYHKKWDIPRDSTMALFFKQYPQYAQYTWQQEGFNWLWYYAMQHLGDAEAAHDAQLLAQKLQQRERSARSISRFFPTLFTQLHNNELAQSHLGNYIQFLDSTTRFHEQLRQHFYPKIFTAAPVLQEQWDKYQPRYCNIKNQVKWYAGLYNGVFVLVLGAIALFRLMKYRKEHA